MDINNIAGEVVLSKKQVQKIKRPILRNVYFDCKWITKKSFDKIVKANGITIEYAV